MIRLGHFKRVRRRRLSCFMQVRRITVKQRPGRVLPPNQVNGGNVLNEHPAEPGVDVRQAIDGRQPLRNIAVHLAPGTAASDGSEALHQP